MKEVALAEVKDRLENDPRFLKRIEKSRANLRAGKGIAWEKIQAEENRRTSSSR